MDVLQKVMFAQSVHRPAKVDVPGYVNFVPALAYLPLVLCAQTYMPAASTQPGAPTKADPQLGTHSFHFLSLDQIVRPDTRTTEMTAASPALTPRRRRWDLALTPATHPHRSGEGKRIDHLS